MANSPCEGCAFSPGTVTHEQEPDNHLKGLLCLLGGLPFYCHHTKTGARIDTDETANDRMSKEEVRARQMQTCAGWRREVRELAATGYYKEAPTGTRAIAKMGAEALLKFIEAEEGSNEKELANDLLQWSIKELGEKQSKFEGE